MPPIDLSAPLPPDVPGAIDLSTSLARLNQIVGGAQPPESRRVAKALARLAPAAWHAIRDQSAQAAAGASSHTFAQTLSELADG